MYSPTKYNCFRYIPYSGEDILVKSSLETIYQDEGESLYAAIDIRFVEARWIVRTFWSNDTRAEMRSEYDYTTYLRITDGDNATNTVPINEAFKYLTLNMNELSRQFSKHETTETKTKSVSLTVPPNSVLLFFQREYKFKTSMFFVLKTASGEWNVGSSGGQDIARKECAVAIMSEEFFITDDSYPVMEATGTVVASTVPSAHKEGDRETRRYEDLSDKAKEVLGELGR
ncbi:hypothetical protein AX17_005859 [Amanita inopinata Kibby_2008]|nr:hypothetical protein AX17_005859 [Amanita inopinata Kibby_2008]